MSRSKFSCSNRTFRFGDIQTINRSGINRYLYGFLTPFSEQACRNDRYGSEVEVEFGRWNVRYQVNSVRCLTSAPMGQIEGVS
jgi:hypothetical protein